MQPDLYICPLCRTKLTSGVLIKQGDTIIGYRCPMCGPTVGAPTPFYNRESTTPPPDISISGFHQMYRDMLILGEGFARIEWKNPTEDNAPPEKWWGGKTDVETKRDPYNVCDSCGVIDGHLSECEHHRQALSEVTALLYSLNLDAQIDSRGAPCQQMRYSPFEPTASRDERMDFARKVFTKPE